MTTTDRDLYQALSTVLDELDSNSLECRPTERWDAAVEVLRRERRRLGKQARRDPASRAALAPAAGEEGK